ncbi:MAG: Fic family protein [Parachlamydiales bacterium]|nr:Fic family protein [Parachlamydiales bacterium]
MHPFLDGNGRISRLLTLILLYHSDYSVGQYISIEKIIEQTKDEYYSALQKSSHKWHEGKHDLQSWLEYFLTDLLPKNIRNLL